MAVFLGDINKLLTIYSYPYSSLHDHLSMGKLNNDLVHGVTMLPFDGAFNE
jgi:hypothetical protein